MLRKYFSSTEPGTTLRRFKMRNSRREPISALGLHRHQKHDVIEHVDLNLTPPHANLEPLNMAAALVKTHLAKVVVLRRIAE
jgi:hypothetical protein